MLNIKETRNEHILGHGTLSSDSIEEYVIFHEGKFESIEDYAQYYEEGDDDYDEDEEERERLDCIYYPSIESVISSIKEDKEFLIRANGTPSATWDVQECQSGDIITVVKVEFFTDDELKTEKLKTLTKEKDEIERTILVNAERLSKLNIEIENLK